MRGTVPVLASRAVILSVSVGKEAVALGIMKPTLLDFTPPGTAKSREFDPPTEESDRIAPVRLFMHPFWDKVFMLPIDQPLRTYQTNNKSALKRYANLIRRMTEEVRLDERFPYKAEVFVTLHFSLTNQEMRQIDVDNLAKLFIDLLKGVVIVDDRQICKLWVDKSINTTTGCKVGVKLLDPNEPFQLIPPLQHSEAEHRALLDHLGISLDELMDSASE